MNKDRKSASEWRARLAAARSEAEVLAVSNEFIASFTPFEMELIGEIELPANFESAEQISLTGYDLVRRSRPRDEDAASLLQAFVIFFSDAAARIAVLANRRNARRQTV